jgi:hypothetical protein
MSCRLAALAPRLISPSNVMGEPTDPAGSDHNRASARKLPKDRQPPSTKARRGQVTRAQHRKPRAAIECRLGRPCVHGGGTRCLNKV